MSTQTAQPRSPRLFAATIGLIAGASTIAAVFLVGEEYGCVLFLGAPLVLGLVSTLALAMQAEHDAGTMHSTAQMALGVGLLWLLLLGLEGLICLAMAYPLAAPVTALGVVLGRLLARPRPPRAAHVALLVALSPLLVAFDGLTPDPPLREVETVVEIDAPPEVVWPLVVAFAELPPPADLAFRLGIAYPIRARIEGEGVGAVRYCEFSTGPFVEPITRWEAPHRLSFDVVAQPPTMHELSPWGDIAPRHLTESLHSERGEFRLVALPGGRTRLEGSTWYRHELAPGLYWNLWSDALIHRIHRRVLHSIAARAEESATLPADALRAADTQRR
ncbi:MAG: SRPBCC family protein [Acidobacteriota bacterium]